MRSRAACLLLHRFEGCASSEAARRPPCPKRAARLGDGELGSKRGTGCRTSRGDFSSTEARSMRLGLLMAPSYINILSTNAAAASFILYPRPPGLRVCARPGRAEQCWLHPALAPTPKGAKPPTPWERRKRGMRSALQTAPEQPSRMASLSQLSCRTAKTSSVPLGSAQRLELSSRQSSPCSPR